MDYKHLGLKQWPFTVVPDPDAPLVWAGRKALLQGINNLLRQMERRPNSSINLLWAWYGAGKSHTLRFVQQLSRELYSQLFPLYTVFPRSITSFVDLYRQVVASIEEEDILDAYYERLKGGHRPSLARDLETALRVLAQGTSVQQDIAREWLRAARVDLRTLKTIGIGDRIETSERAVDVLSGLVRLLVNNGHRSRFVWMIDEFQRIGNLRDAVRNEVNVCLHSLFNSVPTGFSLVLAFSIRQQKNIERLVSAELRDRAALQPVLTLPAMSQDEAVEFVKDLMTYHRDPHFNENTAVPLFPFTEAAIARAINILANIPNIELKPRTILQALDRVLAEYEWRIEEGTLDVIDCCEVDEILADMQLTDSEEP